VIKAGPTWPARDYNRGLWLPVQWAHMLWHLGPAQLWGWASRAERRWWARPTLLPALGTVATLPFDGWLSTQAKALRAAMGGDLRRELEALQQYGQFTVTTIGMILVWQLDRARRGVIRTWLLAVLIAVAIYQPMKMLLGRPRPKFDHPHTFIGPFGQYPLGPEIGVRHSWEFWAGISSDLWSMPSSHTASAMVMSCVIAWLYPSIRVLGWVLLAVVAGMRVMTGAHYVSDVIVGAAVGMVAFAAARRWHPVRGPEATKPIPS
jgi:membrane-associated phospholipid phosphatase